MAFLVDFLKCLPSDGRAEEAFASPELKEWKKLRQECDVMLEGGYFHGGYSMSKPERLILQKERRLLDTIWKRYQFVPSQMYESALGNAELAKSITYVHRNAAEDLGRFAHSPRVKLSEIRAAAEKLSYMILPVSYLAKKAEWNFYVFEGARREIQRWILSIKEYTEQDLYVLCPINFYDIGRVKKEAGQHEVIFGGELMQTKALLDTIVGRSEDTEAYEKKTRENVARMEKILQETAQQLSWIEEAKVAFEKSLNRPVKAQTISEMAIVPDVLFFALQHGISLADRNELAVVLRDLGTDMPASFYLNRGFKERKDNKWLGVGIRKLSFR